MGILTALKRFPGAVIAGFSSFGRRAFSGSAIQPFPPNAGSVQPSMWPERIRLEKFRAEEEERQRALRTQQEERTRALQEEKEKQKRALLEPIPSFSQVIGQGECVERLKRFGELYGANDQTPEHILITGEEGMGKRMLVRAFVKTFNTGIKEIEGRKCQRTGDLSMLLTSLELREALLILNIQELRKPVAELLEKALQSFAIDLTIGKGPGARIHPFELNRFTCLATGPRIGDIPPDLLRCFSLSLTVQPYSNQELKDITVRLASQVGLILNEGVVPMLVNASERTPRSIEHRLRRFTRLGKPTITEADAAQALAVFGLAPQQQGGVENADELDALSGVEFEKLITSMLGRMGFRAEMTRATGDGGIDIVAYLDKPIVGGRYLIQCKRFAGPVGAPIVREFYGAVQAERKAAKGILITTSGFTDQAREFAENLHIELIDRRKLDLLLADMP